MPVEIVARETIPQEGPDSQQREKIGGDSSHIDCFRNVCRAQVRGKNPISSYLRKRPALIMQVTEIGTSDIQIGPARMAFLNLQDLLGIQERKGFQQRRIQ
jgi:hypothetical protein